MRSLFTRMRICNRNYGSITYGSDVVKLFPGSLMGPAFIKDVKGPIPHVKLMPSGGVSIDNVDKWID